MEAEKAYELILEEVTKYNRNILGEDADVSVDMLEMFTGLDLVNVDEAFLDTYNDSFKHLAASYGFGNFKSLYLHALEKDKERGVEPVAKAKSKQKDLAKLVKVKRTVMRNGKPTTMTFYEDPNKGGGGGNKLDKDAPKEEKRQPVPSSELKTQEPEEDDFEGANKQPEAINLYREFSGSDIPKATDADILSSEEGAEAVILYNRKGKYLELSGFAHSEVVEDIEKRAFFQTLRKAWEEGLGVIIPLEHMENYSGIHAIAPYFDMELIGDRYVLDNQGLLDSLGEL